MSVELHGNGFGWDIYYRGEPVGRVAPAPHNLWAGGQHENFAELNDGIYAHGNSARTAAVAAVNQSLKHEGV